MSVAGELRIVRSGRGPKAMPSWFGPFGRATMEKMMKSGKKLRKMSIEAQT
jgi:hypothetical protein